MRSLDMDEIIDSVKKQYADMASRAREEAELWNQKKVRIFYILGHLADTLIQRDLQGSMPRFNALLKGTLTDFSPGRLWDLNQRPFGNWPNALNRCW